MTTTNDNQAIEDFWLYVDDAITKTAFLLGEKIDQGDQRMRNLAMIRRGYETHLKTAIGWKEYPFPGIPIVIKDGDYKLDRMLLHTKLYTRAYFEERPKGGTEIVLTSQHRGGQGFQWYIMSWHMQHKSLIIRATHWMIHRDHEMKRNTIYFTRGFAFDETKGYGLDVPKMFEDWVAIRKVPDSHRRTVMQAANHALRFDKEKDDIEGWVTAINAYGSFELMYKLNSLMSNFDMGEHVQWYLNREFKQFWNLRVLESIWGDRWNSKHFDKEGILKELWYHPNTTHILDKERFDRIFNDWKVVKAKYEEWLSQFRFPPHLQAPPPAERHMLELSDERKQEIQAKADEEEERQRKNDEHEKLNDEAVRKANELFNQPPPTTDDT